MRVFSILAALTVLLAACTAPAASVPEQPTLAVVTVTRAPVNTETVSLVPATSTGTAVPATSTLIPTATLVSTCEPDGTLCIFDNWTFPFSRPIDHVRGTVRVDGTYLFGTTKDGTVQPHHGVEFPNDTGVPVLAAADGVVVEAGDDVKGAGFSPWPNFYGNVIVLEHQISGVEGPVYSLYAHLSAIQVKGGQRVRAGEQIGLVGATGSALGSHLHFEVRTGADLYSASRNPLLWLMPLPGTAALAGRVVDQWGNPVQTTVRIQYFPQADGPQQGEFSATMYDLNEKDHINRDPRLGEGFVLTDLPTEGVYRVTLIAGGLHVKENVHLEAGKLTLLTFIIK